MNAAWGRYHSDMNPSDTCDVCGIDVPPDQGVRTEVSVENAMCPTAMVFHDSCFEQARQFWDVEPAACQIDPDFPEPPLWDVSAAGAQRD